jgi:polyhydroxyalkanoate synthesis regulator protein
MSQAFGGIFPFPSSMGAMEEMSKQNLALFQNAMKMWGLAAVPGAEMPASDAASAANPAAKAGESIDLLRQQLEAMQSQLEALSKKG